MPFRRVLAASDLSEAGDEAVRQADEVTRLYRAELAVLHVLPGPAKSVPVMPQRVMSWSTGYLALEAQVLEALGTRAAALTGRGPDELEVRIGTGGAADVILEQARALGADLVSLGAASPGRLGAVAGRVLRHAPCAVLIARARARTNRILVATDLTDPEMELVAAAADHARRSGAALTAAHCLEAATPKLGEFPAQVAAEVLNEVEAAAERDLDRQQLASALQRFGVQGEPVLVRGRAAPAVVGLARSLRAELVLVGAAGRVGLGGRLLHGVAEEIARSAECPVLVLRAARKRRGG